VAAEQGASVRKALREGLAVAHGLDAAEHDKSLIAQINIMVSPADLNYLRQQAAALAIRKGGRMSLSAVVRGMIRRARREHEQGVGTGKVDR